MRAIILFSGGLDSTVILALALKEKKECIAISFDYGQRHKIELEYAARICQYYHVKHEVITLPHDALKKSALLSDMEMPKNRDAETINNSGIPNTYVPARNTIFLAYATALAEIYEADEIHYGPNFLDRNPYPDCRPAYVDAFQQVLNHATRQAIEGFSPKLMTPLIDWDKKRIVEEAKALKIPIEMTFSCYDPINEMPCSVCDACFLRSQALNN